MPELPPEHLLLGGEEQRGYPGSPGASRLIGDAGIRAAFTRLEAAGVLRFRHVTLVHDFTAGRDERIYAFDFRCSCPGSPWRLVRLPEWTVRAEFVLTASGG